MKFEVVLHQDGCDSSIDVIEAPEGYSADDYIRHCYRKADAEFIKMLGTGEVELVKVKR